MGYVEPYVRGPDTGGASGSGLAKTEKTRVSPKFLTCSLQWIGVRFELVHLQDLDYMTVLVRDKTCIVKEREREREREREKEGQGWRKTLTRTAV